MDGSASSCCCETAGGHRPGCERIHAIAGDGRPEASPTSGCPRVVGRRRLVASLEAPLDLAAETKPNPARTDTFRRLNRTEYRKRHPRSLPTLYWSASAPMRRQAPGRLPAAKGFLCESAKSRYGWA